jgi:hypothetical protein
LPIAGGLTFGAFPIFEYQKNGKTIREDTGETALQTFLINQIDGGVFGRGTVADWGSLDHDAFQKPMPQGEIAGLPRYGDGLIIARDPAALWTPLPQRGALDLVVKARSSWCRASGERGCLYAQRRWSAILRTARSGGEAGPRRRKDAESTGLHQANRGLLRH